MVQVLPSDDDFDIGVPGTYGSHLNLWVRLQSWTTDPGYAGGGTEYGVTWAQDNQLYSGHFSNSINPNEFGERSRGAVCSGTSSTDWPKLAGWAFRQVRHENVQVSASFHVIRGTDTSYLGGDVRYQGVGARISGTLSDSGDEENERLTSVDGYWFLRLGDNTGSSVPAGYKYVLLRSSGGTFTRLAESPVGENIVNQPYSDIGDGRPVRLRITANTNGSGNVDLTCHVGLYTDGSGTITETEVLTFEDSSGSKLTGAGRVGFCQTIERASLTGGHFAAHTCSWFQALNFAGSTLLVRDEWLRHKLVDAWEEVGDNAVATGYSLAQAYTGDLYGRATLINGSAHFFKMLDFSSGNVAVAPADTPVDFPNPFFWSQRPADDDVNQHRSVDAQFPSTGTTTTERAARLCLRESGSTAWGLLGMRAGYIFELARDDDTASGTARLRRRTNGGQSQVLLADVSATVGVDTWYEMEMEVANITGPNQVENAVQIKCYQAGVQVIFTDPATPIPGVSIDATGTVFDETSDRITAGPGEGFGVVLDGSDRPIWFNDWEQGGTAGGSDTPENDQVSIAVAAENAGATGTLLLPLDWPVEKVSAYDQNRHRFDADYEYVGLRNPLNRRRWRVLARATAGTTDRDTLLAFWASHDGVEIPFSWANDEGVTVTVHFVDDELGTILRNPSIYAFDFELEELHS